ncbi:MAG: cyclic nucleotide-binding domain-containing protein [Gammaproteobacteria bacterium]|nr:cyclic nucleotide-binding domain-containing protein [Gammaproteobacteria bacterium]
MSEVVDDAKVLSSSLGVEFSQEEAQVLARHMETIALDDGVQLVAEDESNRNLCLLADGELVVCNMEGDERRVAYAMRPGECAGTRAFIDGTPRKATLLSVGQSTVYTLSPEAFDGLVESHPRLVYKVMRALFRTAHANLMRKNFESEELRHYFTKTHGRY